MAQTTALTLKEDLNAPAMMQKVADALPSHIKPETIIRSVLLAAQKNPRILECTKQSIFKCVIEAAELGLECSGGVLGQGYLVPFKTTCTFIPGYRGLIDLARRAGDFTMFSADVVYEGDSFTYDKGLNPDLKHTPGTTPRDPKKITHAYAIARTKDGDAQFEVMTRAEVENIRAKSRAKDNGPWVTDYGQMCRKTAVRRLIKMLPLSLEKIRRALEISDAEYVFGQESQHAGSRYIQRQEGQSVSAALAALPNKSDEPEPEPEHEPDPQEPVEAEIEEPKKSKGKKEEASTVEPIQITDDRLDVLQKAVKNIAFKENRDFDDVLRDKFSPATSLEWFTEYKDETELKSKNDILNSFVTKAKKILKESN